MALPQLFSIGEMAKIFHLSVSSLRHYEALGLVTPEYVDPSTNYRYYSVRQFEPLNTIRYLRAMDMPLTEIADFLQNRDVETIEEKLRAQKAAVVQKQKELKRIERKLDARLSQLQDVRHAPLGEITLIHSPALRLFWIDTALTAPDSSALELSTSRLAAAQAEAHYDPKIAQVMSYINENLCGELNVDVLAERVFLSKYHFMRLFKAQTGVTVHTYVRQKRLVNAARLIREGTPAAKAAADSGFTDYSAFHRAFRESFGMSPGKLKK